MPKLASLAGMVVLSLATPAAAVILVPGDTPLPGTTEALRPELAGTVIEDRLIPYSVAMGGDLLVGAVQQRVVRQDVAGTLDFYWRILPAAGGDLPIFSFRLAGFDGFVTEGDWRSDGEGSVAPTSAFAFPSSGAVNFQFSGAAVGPDVDDASRFFFLSTPATRYADVGRYDLVCGPVGCVSDVFSTFAPLAVIPEPAGWAMMITGFFGAGALLRQRRAAALRA